MGYPLQVKEKVGIFIAIGLTIIGLIAVFGPPSKESQQRIMALTSRTPEDIITFRVSRSFRAPFIEVNASDPMVAAFFHAMTDFHSYPISRDKAKEEHQWFMEIASEEMKWQLSLYIPFQKGEIVVTNFADITERDGSYYGTFQSHLLYQWYQRYSYRWLSSEATQ